MEIIRTETVTTAKAKTPYLDKKHVRLEAPITNTADIYPALSYGYEGVVETAYDVMHAGDIKFYSAPSGKKITYVWFYCASGSQILRIVASDGALRDFDTNKAKGRFTRNKTSVVLANDTAKTQDLTVPSGKEWHVYGGKIENKDDVNRTCHVLVYTKDNILVGYILSETLSANGGSACFPYAGRDATKDLGSFSNDAFPLILEAGDYVRFQFDKGGASSGGTSTIFLNVKEYDV